MKNLKYLLLFSLVAVFIACEKDYEPLSEFSDAKWFVDKQLSKNRYRVLNIGDFMTFCDLSKGYNTRSWSFPDSSGCKFLKYPLDPRAESFYPFIINEGDTLSKDDYVNILFTKAGEQYIRLRNTFPDSVALETRFDVQGGGYYYDYTPAVRFGNEWLLDTAIMVDVYDSLQAGVKVFYITEAGVDSLICDMPYNSYFTKAMAEIDTFRMEAGSSLKFVNDTIVGRPDLKIWNFPKGLPTTASLPEAIVTYYGLGTSQINIAYERNSNELIAANKTFWLPFTLDVTKSSKPFTIIPANAVTEDESEVNGRMLKVYLTGACVRNTVNADGFTVSGTTADGTPIPGLAIESVELSDISSVLNVTLSVPVYDNDIITISYDGTVGGIQSTDERTLESFTTPVTMLDMGNLLPQDIFNFQVTKVNWIPEVGNGSEGSIALKTSPTGTQAMFIEMTSTTSAFPTVTAWPETVDFSQLLYNGATYAVTVKIYLESPTREIGYRFKNSNYAYKNKLYNMTQNAGKTWDADGNAITAKDISSMTGQWLTVTKQFVYNKETTPESIIGPRLQTVGAVYFDNMMLERVDETRP